jgi:hypothetical protein
MLEMTPTSLAMSTPIKEIARKMDVRTTKVIPLAFLANKFVRPLGRYFERALLLLYMNALNWLTSCGLYEEFFFALCQ